MIVLDKVADRDTQRNFEKLAQLVLDTGGVTANVRFGSTSVTWPGGSVNSNAATVTHGLATAPIAAFCQGASDFFNACVVDASGASTMAISCRRLDGVSPGAGTSITVYWLALG